MKTLQFRGPFKTGQIKKINLNTIYNIVQIGIEHLHSIPIQYYSTNKNQNIITHISINDNVYTITDNDILEIDNIEQSSIELIFLQDLNEQTIIDLVFKDKDD